MKLFSYSIWLCIILLSITFCNKNVEIPTRQLKPTKIFKNSCFKVSNSLLDTKIFLELIDCLNKESDFSFISSWLKSLRDEDLKVLIEFFNSTIIELSKQKQLSKQQIEDISKNKITPYLNNISKLIKNKDIELITSFFSTLFGSKDAKDFSYTIEAFIKRKKLFSDLSNEFSKVSKFKKKMFSSPQTYFFKEFQEDEVSINIIDDLFNLSKEHKISKDVIPLLKKFTVSKNFLIYLNSIEIYKEMNVSPFVKKLKKNSTLVYSFLAPNIVMTFKFLEKNGHEDILFNDTYLYFSNLISKGDWVEIEKKIKKENINIFAEKLNDARSIFKNYISKNEMDIFSKTPISYALNSLHKEELKDFLYGINLLLTMKVNDSELLFENLNILTKSANMPIYPTGFSGSKTFETLTGLHLHTHNMSQLAFSTIAYTPGEKPNQFMSINLQNFYKYFNYLKSDSLCSLLVKNCNEDFKASRDLILDYFYCTPKTCEAYLDKNNNFVFLYFQHFLKAMAQTDSLSIFQTIFEKNLLNDFKNIILNELKNNNLLALLNYFTLDHDLINFSLKKHQEKILNLTKNTLSLLTTEITHAGKDKSFLVSEFIEDLIFEATQTLQKRTLLEKLFIDRKGFSLIKSLNPFNLFYKDSEKINSLYQFDDPEKIEKLIRIIKLLLKTLENENEIKVLKKSLENGSLNDLMLDTLKFINLLSKYSSEKR